MFKLHNQDILSLDLKDIPPINLVVTSPPYNLGIDYDTHKDTMTHAQYLEFCEQWIKKMYDVMADDGRICINIPFSVTPLHLNEGLGGDGINYPLIADYINICLKVGLQFWRVVVWDKNLSNKTCWGSWRSASAPYMRDPSEAIVICYKKQWSRLTKGESTITAEEFLKLTKNVWQFQPETHSDHPAAFPLELPLNCMKLLSYKNDWIMDCFMGSGTTGEAAVRNGRNFVGIELSKDYFDKAQYRIESAEFQTNLRKDFFPPDDGESF